MKKIALSALLALSTMGALASAAAPAAADPMGGGCVRICTPNGCVVVCVER